MTVEASKQISFESVIPSNERVVSKLHSRFGGWGDQACKKDSVRLN